MSELAKGWLSRLHPVDPYAGFPNQEYPLDLQGGAENSLLMQLIDELRPRLVIEVGTWKGATAVRLATRLKQLALDSAIVCVDTWLGSVEHWEGSIRGWDIRPYLKHGYPTLYHQFLANVLHNRCEDVIVPFPNTSANAARWMERQKMIADLVYVDASHEEDEVYRDLRSYWPLLRPGGVLAGDDWHAYWYGVICAVNRFAREQALSIQISGQTWILRKPA